MGMLSPRSLILRAALLAILAVAATTNGQMTGEITGQVVDETGASVPDARVVILNTATGETREFQTDATGSYLVPQLFPGTYQITVEKTGFRRFVRSGVVLQVGQRARIDVRLTVGTVTESVEVTAATPLLESEDAALGQVIENRKILELPLNGRNIVALAALATGVVPGTSFGIGVPEGRAALIQAAAANLVVNGGISAHNDVLVDGIPLSLCCQNQIAFIPSIDTIEEFRVRSNLYDAQYGRTSGGVITYASKSGSNEFRGSLFEFLRNDNLDANNFFSNRAGLPKGHFVYNQFGGRIGGPVVRDKFFFFGNYEGIRNRRASFLSGNVPTPEELGGQFRVPVYDPLTVQQQGGAFIRQPFAGNRVPASRFDPVAVNLGKLWPAPNASGATNFISNASASDTENQTSVRLDYHVTQNNRLFGRYSYNHNNGDLPDWFGNIASPNVFSQRIRNHNAVLNDTFIASPTFVMNFRYGFTRQSNIRRTRSHGTDLTHFGWPASFSAARQDTSLPRIDLTGFLRLSSNALFERIAEAHSTAASFTQIRGRHTWRYGLDLRVYRANWVNNPDAAGIFAFNTAFTRGPNAQTGGGGSPVASFLLGYPASGRIVRLEPFASPQLYSGIYLQDDFRVSNRLTLNLGVRWEVETPRWERFNRLSYFDPFAPSPVAFQTGIPGLRGGLKFVGADGNPRKQQDIDWNNLGPRFGFAWTAHTRVVLRGGYGITFIPITSRYVNNSNQGFAASTEFFSSVDGITPVGVLRDPFPNGVRLPPGAANGLLTSYGESFGTLLRQSPVGYTQQWSFNVQYELAPSTLVDLAYAGSKGTALPTPVALNNLPSALLSQGTALLSPVPNPFRPYVASGPLTAANTTRLQLQRPFPQFLALTDNMASIGSSSYHSFQLKVDKRFSRGFSVLGSYTTGKLITDTVPSLVSFLDPAPAFQDVYKRQLDRAIATQDVAQRLVISYVWEVPVGRGKRFLVDSPRLVDAILGGWQINGITTLQSGTPLVLGNSVPTTSGATRPHNLGRSAKKTGDVSSRLNEYFDTRVFAAPGPFEFGSAPRTLPDVRSDGIRNFDISIFKNFALTERSQLQFRAELFNLFNTPRFDAPNGTFGHRDFGVISAQKNQPRDIQLALRFSF
jgi:hypothetical protein